VILVFSDDSGKNEKQVERQYTVTGTGRYIIKRKN
jgi:hypothetical protein